MLLGLWSHAKLKTIGNSVRVDYSLVPKLDLPKIWEMRLLTKRCQTLWSTDCVCTDLNLTFNYLIFVHCCSNAKTMKIGSLKNVAIFPDPIHSGIILKSLLSAYLRNWLLSAYAYNCWQ